VSRFQAHTRDTLSVSGTRVNSRIEFGFCTVLAALHDAVRQVEAELRIA
jgi:hypothetical protein